MRRLRGSLALLTLTLTLTLSRSDEVHARSTRAWPEAKMMIDQWTVEDGLPLDHAMSMAVSPGGFVWLATTDGLVRFDGDRFHVYRRSDYPELATNRFVAIGFGDDEGPWVASEYDHLLRFDGRHFRSWAAQSDERLWLYQGRALVLTGFPGGPTTMQTIHGETWIATREHSVFRIVDGTEARPIAGLEALRDVWGLVEDPAGGAWLGARDGLWHFGPRGLEATAPGQPREPVQTLSRTDRLWVGDAAGWWTYDGATVEVLDDLPEDEAAKDPFWVQGRGSLAQGGGVWRARPGWIARDRVRTSVPGLRAWAATDDGSLWLATSGSGLFRFRPAEVRTVAAEAGAIFDVLVTPDDGVWGIPGGTRKVVELARDGEALPTPWPQQPLPDGSLAIRMLVGPDRAMLVTTLRPGALWRRAGDHLERRDDFPGRVPVATTSDGRLWLHEGDALFAGRPEGATWRWDQVPFARETTTTAAHEATDGALWLGTLGRGVARVTADGVRWWSVAEGLASSNVRAVWVEQDTAAWIGTEDAGLCRLDLATDAVRCLDTRDGLFDDTIHSVQPDDRGRLWMSTNRGIFWVLRAQLEEFIAGARPTVLCVGLRERDGMADREANGGNPQSFARDRAGRLWYPTQAGLTVVEPASVPLPPPPRVYLEDPRIDGAPAVPVDEVLQLAADHRELTVAWTTPEFTRPEQVRFRYRMHGLDDDWRPPTAERRATWTRLPPGDLELEVQAALGGAWGPSVRLAVHRAPAFVETRAFLASLVLAGLGLGVLVSLWRDALSRRRQAALEVLVAARTAALADLNRTLVTQKDTLATQASTLESQAGQLRDAADALARKNIELTVAAARLAEVDALRTRLIADLSHELRTPLTLIAGPLEDLARADEVPAGPARDRVEVVLRNARRLESLVEQLFDLTRLEHGKISLRVGYRDLGAKIRDIAARFAPEFKRARLALQLELPNAPVALFFDVDLIDKVLTNLLSNALKFTPAGGRVCVRLTAPRDEDESVRVEVQDTGIGVSEALRARLFDRFVQGDHGDARRFEGVGIGLALARDLVTLHGGEIGVEPAPERGSVFWWTLPRGVDHLGPEDIQLGDDPPARDLARAGQATLPPPTDGAEDRPRVLVVEDHPDMREFLAAHLGRSFRVTTAPGGAEALALARADPPAAIVSDVMMPGMDGLALCRHLRADPRLRAVPILLASAKATEEDRVAGLEVADDYMTKPLRMRELLARVDKLVARAAARTDAAPADVVADADTTAPTDAAPTDAGLGEADRALQARIEAVVAARMSDPEFGVEQMARALAFSRRQLLRETQRVTGESPSDLLRARRIAEGHRLLVSGAVRTVGEAAARVGLSASYFSRTYTAWYKRPPSEVVARA